METKKASALLPHAASPVNVIGRVQGDATAFKSVRAGATVRLERSEAEATGR
ncbi:MAG: hypothetical protein EXR54_05325 [Dehalococcoidia bacterium]|nr:hypothetical protein [Dehalococcoidia bacterium]